MPSKERSIAVLNWPTEFAEQLQTTDDIIAAITAGTTGISTAAAATAKGNAKTAQDEVATGAHGATKTRNGKFDLMHIEVKKMMAKVQEQADDLPFEDAEALILSNGFHLKGHGIINKEKFEVRNSELSGEVELIAKAAEEDQAHEWYYSIDKGITWNYIPTTIQSKRKHDGFNRGQLVLFRHRIILRSGPQDWDYDDVVIL